MVLSGGRSSSEIPRGVDLADVREAIPGDAAKTHREREGEVKRERESFSEEEKRGRGAGVFLKVVTGDGAPGSRQQRGRHGQELLSRTKTSMGVGECLQGGPTVGERIRAARKTRRGGGLTGSCWWLSGGGGGGLNPNEIERRGSGVRC